MNTVIWLIAGALIAWAGFSAARLNERIGRGAAVVVGAMAGIFGGKVIAPFFGAVALEPGGFSPSALFFAVATSAVVLVAGHFAQARWWP